MMQQTNRSPLFSHHRVLMARPVMESAVESGRYDLLTPYPDAWVSIASLKDMAADGYHVLSDDISVLIPEEQEGDQTIPEYELGEHLIAWRGGYYVAELDFTPRESGGRD